MSIQIQYARVKGGVWHVMMGQSEQYYNAVGPACGGRWDEATTNKPQGRICKRCAAILRNAVEEGE